MNRTHINYSTVTRFLSEIGCQQLFGFTRSVSLFDKEMIIINIFFKTKKENDLLISYD